jgi:hypothetical protein
MDERPHTITEVLDVFPRVDVPKWAEDVPRDLVGAKIVKFGAAPRILRIEGVGLVIDYIPDGDAETRQIVLAFSENGMWKEGA